MDTEWLVNCPTGSPTVVLAHGAGAPYDTPFMTTIAEGVAQAGMRVIRFEFPYMQKRRVDGVRRGPNAAAILQKRWRAVVQALRPAPLFIGGKSMGGRIASMLADELNVEGLICLGYPFHPAGRPERLRTEHLRTLKTPTLILQGSRDPMGKREEVAGYTLAETIQVRWLEDGDHSFRPRKRSGLTEAQHLNTAIAAIVSFVQEKHRQLSV